MLVEIRHKITRELIIFGEYENLRLCLEKNKGADLRDAYLGDADLRGARNYRDSHDIFAEAVRRVGNFTESEWVAIAQIIIHMLCWDSIRKRFNSVMPGIFQKLANDGWSEWLDYWEGK